MPLFGDNDLTLKLEVEGDGSGVRKVSDEVDSFEKRIAGAETRLNSFNKSFQSMAAVGAAGAAVLGFSIKTAIDFQSAWTGVTKTVELSESEFDRLNQGLKDMSRTMPTSYVELAKLGEVAGSLGVEGTDNILKFVKTTAMMGETTNLSSEAAATAFAQIANVMQEPIQNIDRMGAAVVGLGNRFAAQESDIVSFASRIAGAGKIAGLTTADVFGISTAMASVGIEAEAGGSAVQKVLMDMTQSVATGDKKLSLFAATAGMTAKEFAKQWKTDPSEAFAAFVNGLGVAGQDAFKILDELELKDVRLTRAFLSLANAGDLVNRAISQGSEETAKNNALINEAAKRHATAASQIEIFRNNVQLLGDTLGATFLPKINDLIQNYLIPLFGHLNTWIGQNPELINSILGIALAIGGAGVAGLTLIPAILNWIRLIMTLMPLIQGLAAVMLGPWGLAIAATILAATMLYVAWKDNMFGIRGITENVVNFIIDRFNSVLKLINSIVDLSNKNFGTSFSGIGAIEHVNFDGGGSSGASGSWQNFTPAPVQSTVQYQTPAGGATINQTNNIYSSVDLQSMLRDITFAANTG